MSTIDTNPVAVLVLAYNHEKFIRACIDSIIRSSLERCHIWVLDDGSTDGTVEILTEIVSEHNNITLIKQSHSGGLTSQSSQRLIEASVGQYVVLISGDDMIGPADGLQRAVDAMERNTDLDVVIPRMVYLMEDPAIAAPPCHDASLLAALRSGSAGRVIEEHLYRSVSRIFLQGMVLRRATFEAFGGFDTALRADDYAFVMRLFGYLAREKQAFLFDENSLWLYRIHGANAHRNPVRQFTVVAEVLEKYIPLAYRGNFAWDAMIVREVSDFRAMQAVASRFLDRNLTRKSLKPTFRASIRSAAMRGDLTLLGKFILCKGLTLQQRLVVIGGLFKGVMVRLSSEGRRLCR